MNFQYISLYFFGAICSFLLKCFRIFVSKQDFFTYQTFLINVISLIFWGGG